jgi:hypothetical protein
MRPALAQRRLLMHALHHPQARRDARGSVGMERVPQQSAGPLHAGYFLAPFPVHMLHTGPHAHSVGRAQGLPPLFPMVCPGPIATPLGRGSLGPFIPPQLSRSPCGAVPMMPPGLPGARLDLSMVHRPVLGTSRSQPGTGPCLDFGARDMFRSAAAPAAWHSAPQAPLPQGGPRLGEHAVPAGSGASATAAGLLWMRPSSTLNASACEFVSARMRYKGL